MNIFRIYLKKLIYLFVSIEMKFNQIDVKIDTFNSVGISICLYYMHVFTGMFFQDDVFTFYVNIWKSFFLNAKDRLLKNTYVYFIHTHKVNRLHMELFKVTQKAYVNFGFLIQKQQQPNHFEVIHLFKWMVGIH